MFEPMLYSWLGIREDPGKLVAFSSQGGDPCHYHLNYKVSIPKSILEHPKASIFDRMKLNKILTT